MRSGVIGLRLPARLIRDSLTYFIFSGYNLTKAFWIKTTAANDAVSHPEAKLPVRNSKAERKNKLAQEDLCRDKKSRWPIAVAVDQDIPRAAGWGSGAMHGLTLLLLEAPSMGTRALVAPSGTPSSRRGQHGAVPASAGGSGSPVLCSVVLGSSSAPWAARSCLAPFKTTAKIPLM